MKMSYYIISVMENNRRVNIISLSSIVIWPCSRCRWFAWSYPWSFTHEILKIYPLFVANHNSLEKWLSFVSGEQHFASDFSVFLLSFIQFIVEPIFPSSGSFPWISNVWRWLLVLHSIDSRVVIEFERHPHSTMLAIRCLQIFSMVFHVLRFSHQNHFFEFFTRCISLNPLFFSQKNTFFFLGNKNKFIQSTCPR